MASDDAHFGLNRALNRGARGVGIGLLLSASVGLIAGCEGQPPVIDRFAHAGSVAEPGVRGDFDDLETSIDTGLTKAGVAPVHWHEPVPGTRIYELRTARDQPGELVVVVGQEALPDGSVPVELRCRIGRFGEPELERRVMAEIARRLEELRGREVYRIKW